MANLSGGEKNYNRNSPRNIDVNDRILGKIVLYIQMTQDSHFALKISEIISRSLEGISTSYPVRALARVGWPRQRILIASLPRCGSTIFLRSLAGLPVGSVFPKVRDCYFARDLTTIPNCRFIKTHSLAPVSLPDDVIPIFLFGDPVDAIYSTVQKRWDSYHFGNCGYFSRLEPNMVTDDELGYEAIFDSWMTPKSYPVLAIRCEEMNKNESAICEYLGINVSIPQWKNRNLSDSQDVLYQKIAVTHKAFRQKVENAPDCVRIS